MVSASTEASTLRKPAYRNIYLQRLVATVLGFTCLTMDLILLSRYLMHGHSAYSRALQAVPSLRRPRSVPGPERRGNKRSIHGHGQRGFTSINRPPPLQSRSSQPAEHQMRRHNTSHLPSRRWDQPAQCPTFQVSFDSRLLVQTAHRHISLAIIIAVLTMVYPPLSKRQT